MRSSAGDAGPDTAVRGTIRHVTPASPVAPSTTPRGGATSGATDPTEPTNGCARCGAPVAIGVGLCERCNPLGLRDVSASQVHGTVFLGVLGAFILLAIVARLAITGIGPFPVTIDGVVPAAAGLEVTLTVTNEGDAEGQTTCRVMTASNRGGGPVAFVLSPAIAPGETVTFDQVVTGLGTEVTDLVAECRTP